MYEFNLIIRHHHTSMEEREHEKRGSMALHGGHICRATDTPYRTKSERNNTPCSVLGVVAVRKKAPGLPHSPASGGDSIRVNDHLHRFVTECRVWSPEGTECMSSCTIGECKRDGRKNPCAWFTRWKKRPLHLSCCWGILGGGRYVAWERYRSISGTELFSRFCLLVGSFSDMSCHALSNRLRVLACLIACRVAHPAVP